MKFHEPKEGGVVELLTAAIFGDAGIKHYAFSGDGQCVQCGKIIDASVNVASHEKEVIP